MNETNDKLPLAKDLSDVEINSMCDEVLGVVGGTAWDSDYCKNLNAVAKLWKYIDDQPRKNRDCLLLLMLSSRTIEFYGNTCAVFHGSPRRHAEAFLLSLGKIRND